MSGGEYPPAPQIDSGPTIANTDIGPARVVSGRLIIESLLLALDDETHHSSRDKNIQREDQGGYGGKLKFRGYQDLRTPPARPWDTNRVGLQSCAHGACEYCPLLGSYATQINGVPELRGSKYVRDALGSGL